MCVCVCAYIWHVAIQILYIKRKVRNWTNSITSNWPSYLQKPKKHGLRCISVTSRWTVSICHLELVKQHQLVPVPQPTAGYHAGPSHSLWPFAGQHSSSSNQGGRGGPGWEQGDASAATTLTTSLRVLLTQPQRTQCSHPLAQARWAGHGVSPKTTVSRGRDTWIQPHPRPRPLLCGTASVGEAQDETWEVGLRRCQGLEERERAVSSSVVSQPQPTLPTRKNPGQGGVGGGRIWEQAL